MEKGQLTGVIEQSRSSRQVKTFKEAILHTQQLTDEQLQLLCRIHSSAAQMLAACLERISRGAIAVKAASPQELSAAECEKFSQAGGVVGIFSPTKEVGQAFIALDSVTANYLLDRMLGGSGEPLLLERPRTELERTMLGGGVEELISAYAQAWNGAISFAPKMSHLLSFAAGEKISLAEGAIFVFGFSLRLGKAEGEIIFALPRQLLRALPGGRQQEFREISPPAEARSKVVQVLEEVEIPLSAVLGTARLPLSEVMEMKVGDMVCLDSGKLSEVQLRTTGRETLLAKPVALEGRLAMQIIESCNQGGK